MHTSDTSQPETESMLQTLSLFNVGLGAISLALFPFLLPGIAILALFALPLLPLVPVVLVGWLAVRLAVQLSRTVRSSSRRRARSDPAGVTG